MQGEDHSVAEKCWALVAVLQFAEPAGSWQPELPILQIPVLH